MVVLTLPPSQQFSLLVIIPWKGSEATGIENSLYKNVQHKDHLSRSGEESRKAAGVGTIESELAQLFSKSGSLIPDR